MQQQVQQVQQEQQVYTHATRHQQRMLGGGGLYLLQRNPLNVGPAPTVLASCCVMICNMKFRFKIVLDETIQLASDSAYPAARSTFPGQLVYCFSFRFGYRIFFLFTLVPISFTPFP